MPRAYDRNPQKRGLGNSLYNPLRSGLTGWTDPMSAIDAAAQSAGSGIRQRFEDTVDQALDGVVQAVLDLTGIDISGPVELLEQLLGIPLAFLDATSLGAAIDVLGQFLPFLPGADADTFDPLSAAAAFITDILNPTNLIPLLTGGLLSGTVIPGLDASKIISGVFGTGLIPGLDASKITSGTFPQSMIAGLADALSNAGGALADAIVQALGGSGTGHDADDVLAALQAIPGANIIGSIAASLISGVLGAGQIPGLDASKIISGQFSQSQVTDLVEDLSLAVWNAGSALQGMLQLSRTGGSNMVLAPDFEDDAAWDHALGEPTTEQARSGTKSRKLTADGSWRQLVLTHDPDGDPIGVPTVPGRTYYIEVHIRAHAANATPAGVNIYVTGVSTDNAGVDTWVNSNVIKAASLSSSGWETKSVRVTMPAGAVSFRPVVWLPDDVAVGDVFYVDYAVVQDVTESQSVVSTIIAALGGTGSQFAGLTQALENIPQGNILGLPSALAAAGTDIADAIVHAMGGSGTGHDAADVIAHLVNIPTGNVAGLLDLKTIIETIRDILAGLPTVPTSPILQDIKDWFTGNINKTQNLTVGGLFDATKLTGLVDPESVGGVGGAADMGAAVQGTIDKIVQAAGDLTGGGFGLDDLLGGLAGLRNTATGANEYVIDIQNQLVENAIGGISAIVKIADYADAATPPSVFTKVLDTGSGSIVTSGGKLVWSGRPGKEMYLYNVEALQSDLFEVSFVMPNAPTHGPFGVDGDNFLYPIGRSNSAGTAMCFAEVGWKSVRIGCLASGVTTWFRSVDWHGGSYEVPSGALVKFKGGTIENGRYFQVFVNNQMVLDAYDNLSVSQLGASFRNCGIGMQDDSDYSTGTVSVWSMVDGNLGIATGTVTGYNNGVLASLKLWTGTAAQYAAIGTKDSATVYVVTA